MAEFDIKSSLHHPLSDSENTTIYLDMEDQEEDYSDHEANITAHALTRRVITGDSITVPPLLETQNSFYIDVQGEVPNRVDILNQRDTTPEQIFLITNFALELPSAVFDQLSSVHKPQYALISMIMSFTIMLISMVDLARMGRKERVKWMIRGHVPWFYSPDPSYKPLGTFADIVGLVCAIFQCVFATIAYAFLSQHDDNPIKLSVWPLIFAFGVLCSRFPRNPCTIVVREHLDIQPRGLESLSPLNNLHDLWIPEINPPQSFEPLSKQIHDLRCLEIDPRDTFKPQSKQKWNLSQHAEPGSWLVPDLLTSCLYMPTFPCSSWLRELVLWNCPNLMFLPEDMRILEKASHLVLEDCPNFLCLPEYLWTLEKLEFLRIRGCPRLKFSPQQIRLAARIKYLSIDNCLL